ncbi:S-layer homology domain-containing protein [Paenibacillus sp. F411]|uniref:glycosyl hydrolase n=1 Tax=Paenibacillus sp. F411 TaxID=2820239 RepID=UPI001AAE3FB3|nr:glycosyl hydrolase [Paenibacillus sp. F411]MBO2944374.1 S-layer homology domain-containing protein [Paenibacillus sp. F411]
MVQRFHKKVSLLLCALLVFTLLQPMFSGVQASEAHSTVPMSDNFEAGNESETSSTVSTADWKTIAASSFENQAADWKKEGGSFELVPSGSGQGFKATGTSGNSVATFGSAEWKDISVEAKLTSDNWNNNAGVIARYQDSNNYYWFYYEPGSRKFHIQKRVNKSKIAIGNIEKQLVAGQTYTFKFVVTGDQLEGYVDGELVVSGSDSAYPAGKAGINSYLNPVVYQDVVIAALDDTPPSSPVGLRLLSKTENSVVIGWEAATDGEGGISEYIIYRDQQPITRIAVSADGLGHEEVITGLNASTSYDFAVKAKNNTGLLSEATDTLTVITQAYEDSQPPTVPQQLSLQSPTETTMTLSWESSSDNLGVYSYELYVDDVLHHEAVEPRSVNGKVTQLIGKLNPGSEYSIKVRAKDLEGNVSDFSAAVSGVTLEPMSTRTDKTINLLKQLYLLEGKLLWGTQMYPGNPGGYKQSFDYVHELSGQYPGFVGSDFSPSSEKVDNPPYITAKLMELARAGSVISVSQHQRNYLTGNTSWVKRDSMWQPGMNAVQAVMPGGSKHAEFVKDLDELALMLNTITLSDGSPVPVIYRPFHEMNGGWFWWGKDTTTPEEYIQLFRYTIDYLRNVKQVKNMLVAWAPSGSAAYYEVGTNVDAIKAQFFKYYPGDAYVDIIGLDNYNNNDKKPILEDEKVYPTLLAIVGLAEDRGKVPAMTEGHSWNHADITDYWTNHYLNAFKSDPVLNKIRYAMTWFTYEKSILDGGTNKFSPYTGVASAEGFKDMAEDPYVLMQNEYDWYADPGIEDVIPPTRPGQPTLQWTGDGTMLVQWEPSTDARGVGHYELQVYKGLSTAVTPLQSWTLDRAAQSQVIEGLLSGESYTVTVRAIDTAGLSSTSAAAVWDGHAPQWEDGARLTAEISGNFMKLVWPAATDNVAVSGYKVYREQTEIPVVVTVSDSVYTLLDAPAQGLEISYGVRAVDAAGNLSLPISVRVGKAELSEGEGTAPVDPTPAPSAPLGGGTKESTPELLEAVPVFKDGRAIVMLEDKAPQFTLSWSTLSSLEQIPLEIHSERLSMIIPAAVLQQLRLAAGLAGAPSGQQGKEGMVTFTAVPADTSEAEAAVTSLQTSELETVRSVGVMYEFSFTVTQADGTEAVVSQFKEPILMDFRVDVSADRRRTGVYYVDSQGKFEYAGGRWLTNGKLRAPINHFSSYAVLEVRKAYDDLSDSHWASSSIEELSAKQIVNGMTARTFQPDTVLTRAQFTQMLIKLLHVTQKSNALAPASSEPFEDVQPTAWYAKSIAAAQEAELIAGVSVTQFAPEQPVTREQMAVMLVRAAQRMELTQASRSGTGEDETSFKYMFNDVVDRGWSGEWIQQAAELKLMQGRAAGVFAPMEPTTRAEASRALVNLLELSGGEIRP